MFVRIKNRAVIHSYFRKMTPKFLKISIYFQDVTKVGKFLFDARYAFPDDAVFIVC